MRLPAFLWLALGAALLGLTWLLPPEIEIEWVTGSEYETVGFNIYRADALDGPFTQLNAALIAAEGTVTSGSQYRFVDRYVNAGQIYYYVLEDIEFTGRRERHEPIIGQAANIRWWSWPLALVSFLLGIGLLLLDRKRTGAMLASDSARNG
jgi:hypothetical protein